MMKDDDARTRGETLPLCVRLFQSVQQHFRSTTTPVLLLRLCSNMAYNNNLLRAYAF